jgi:hypothetical protein
VSCIPGSQFGGLEQSNDPAEIAGTFGFSGVSCRIPEAGFTDLGRECSTGVFDLVLSGRVRNVDLGGASIEIHGTLCGQGFL